MRHLSSLEEVLSRMINRETLLANANLVEYRLVEESDIIAGATLFALDIGRDGTPKGEPSEITLDSAPEDELEPADSAPEDELEDGLEWSPIRIHGGVLYVGFRSASAPGLQRMVPPASFVDVSVIANAAGDVLTTLYLVSI